MPFTIPFRHHRKDHSQNSGNEKAGAKSFFLKLYKLSYFTGRQTLRIAHSGRLAVSAVFNVALSELVAKAEDVARNLSEFQRSRAGRGEVSPTRGLIDTGHRISQAFRICRVQFRRGGFLSGLAAAGEMTRRGAARFFVSRRQALNYLAPVMALIVLGLTIYFWNTSCFALSVTYEGKSLGIVTSEQTYSDAANQVEDNVSDASGSNFTLSQTPSFKLVLAKRSALVSEDQLYNNIITMSCTGVQSGYGLYVDNRLAGANADSNAIEAMLTNMTAKYEDDPSVQSAGFVQNVSIKSGVFPGSVFKSVNEIKDIVTAKKTTGDGVVSAKAPGTFRISVDPLYAMNLTDGDTLSQTDAVVTGTSEPTLTVKVVKNEIKTQAIPFTTQNTNSTKLKKGTKTVSQKGENGEESIVAAVTYVDGVETGEEVLSTTVTKQPVTQKILIGTKKPSSDSSDSAYNDDGGDPQSSNPNTTGGLIGYAERELGIRYVSGGGSPSGFDCSGFTAYVFARYGISLPHSAAAQSAYGTPVKRSALEPGDLVFFDTNGGHNSITHVGIYVGGGSFVDASSARPHAVTVDSLNSNYYSNRYMTARRVAK